MLNSMIASSLSSIPLKGRKNNAKGAPNRANKTLPHIGHPAENKPVINPPAPTIPLILLFLSRIQILYAKRERYTPKSSDDTANKKKVAMAYQKLFIITKIFMLWFVVVARVKR